MKVLLTSIFLFAAIYCFAQSTVLDKTFGNNGFALPPNTAEATQFDFDTSGNIISVGYIIYPYPSDSLYHTILTKHDKNGILDSTFGDNGLVTTALGMSSTPFAMTITPDNKIFAAGSYTLLWPPKGPGGGGIFIAKYHNDGTYDSSWGVNGIVNIQGSGNIDAITLLPGNKIMAGGHLTNSEAVIMKLNPDGSFDNQFGVNGIQSLQEPGFMFGFWKFLLLSNGSLLCSGYDGTDINNTNLAVVKVDTNGNIVTGFGNNGKLIIDRDTNNTPAFIYDLAELPDGRIFLYGADTSGVIIRIHSDGTLDSSWATNGILSHYYPAQDIAILDNGNFLLAGIHQLLKGFYMTMLDSTGVLDTSFANLGQVNIGISNGSDYARCVKMQEHGKAIVGGSSGSYNAYHAALIRINTEKSLSVNNKKSLTAKEINIYPNPFGNRFFIATTHTISRISVFNCMGQEVTTINNYHTGNLVDMTGVPAGVYYLAIDTEQDGIATKRIVKL